MTAESAEKSDTIQSVVLALQVLETLANANGDMGVTALASALDTTKSRIHRHLRTLVSLGYISQSELTERYRIGARLIALGRAASGSADLTSVAQRHMRALRDRTGQAVSLGQVEANGIRILNTLPGKMPIEVGVRPGSLLKFGNSAQGKVALASMPEARRQELIPETIAAETAFTITDRAALMSHIAQVAECGWATAPNETMLGLNALACPILNADGEPVATVAIVSLTQYIETPPQAEQIEAVREAAARISSELGYSA
ncbi:IclR family transcriptional regulator [Pseudodonghicola xiamenensis]|uniref:IclR family transcriptional regulator n=1 Tax=Pseudodonghicola xiamenensis TaxID=337702 RepID=A0A8J3H4G3_9RHOB|nr:IclR family transcriptional regulator [Pseudodonghicola xiamenensis]GHG79665.1 IclR family transcriptional regulator [Pseudodonghicola xiamenensis]